MNRELQHTNNRLDLHGVRHNEVDRLVENFVLLEEPPLTIICGNSDKMIRIVENTLDKLRVPSNPTPETERLTRTLFKLDVIRNAINNISST